MNTHNSSFYLYNLCTQLIFGPEDDTKVMLLVINVIKLRGLRKCVSIFPPNYYFCKWKFWFDVGRMLRAKNFRIPPF